MTRHVFITKPGDNVRLTPEDEYQHAPESASNFNESAYYNLYDPKTGLGGWFRIGNRVNEGHAEVSICLYLPDGRVGFMYHRAAITSNVELKAGGAHFEVLEPFRRQRVSYTGELVILADPGVMANPGKAFKHSPRAQCTIALNYQGVSPMYGGEALNPDGSAIELDPQNAMARAHFEQHVRAQGSITVDSNTWSVDGFGLRDHSWGPRYWQNIYWYRWLPISFGEDFGAMIMTIGLRDGSTDCGGMVFTNGRYDLITDAHIESFWNEHYYQTGLRASVTTERGEQYEFTGRVFSLIPLRNQRTLDSGTLLSTRITEGMTEYRCNDRVGYGLSEYLDQVEDGKPVRAAWEVAQQSATL